jgi:DNA replication protein DnaC
MVLLLGERGTGKTQMAVEMMQGYIEHLQRPALFYDAAEMFDVVKATFNAEATTEQHRALSRLYTVGLLVIDEIQERRHTEHEDQYLGRILNKRYGEMLPTVIIANLKPSRKVLIERFGPSVYSRMEEIGKTIVVDWESYRTKPSKGAQ